MGTRSPRSHNKIDNLSTGTAVFYTYGNEVDNVSFHYKSNGIELCSFTVTGYYLY